MSNGDVDPGAGSETGRLIASDAGVWRLPPKQLGPPTGASDVLADSIRATPQPDVAAAEAMMSSYEALWAIVEARNAEAAANVPNLLETLGVSVTEDRVGAAHTYRVTPSAIEAAHEDHLFVYVHGGAYVLNAGEAGLAEAAIIAASAKPASPAFNT